VNLRKEIKIIIYQWKMVEYGLLQKHLLDIYCEKPQRFLIFKNYPFFKTSLGFFKPWNLQIKSFLEIYFNEKVSLTSSELS